MKFMIKRGVKGVFGGLEGDERRWKEGTEKVELASGKDYYSSEKLAPDIGNGVSDAGLRFSSTCSLHAADLTIAGHPISSAGLTPIPRLA